MWAHLYSDHQLKQMEQQAQQQVADTKQPLHPDYGDKVVKALARETITEVKQALNERKGK